MSHSEIFANPFSLNDVAEPGPQTARGTKDRQRATPLVERDALTQGCIKLLDFSLSSIGWRRGLGRGGAFLLVSPLLGPLHSFLAGRMGSLMQPCVLTAPRLIHLD
jgi:hypothetical protein